MGVRTLALAVLLALPAAAEPLYLQGPDFPLPLRDAPGGAPVSDLAPGARVETTGEDGAWVRVPLAEADAWAARDALRPVAVARLGDSGLPDGLLCTGTEPFWSLRLDAAGASFSEPGAETDTFGMFAIAAATGQPRFPALVTMMQEGRSMLAVIRAGACSDGMSDRTQPWQVDLVRQEPDGAGGILTLRTGCCRLPPQP
jgi:uncharacterized membrane protein